MWGSGQSVEVEETCSLLVNAKLTFWTGTNLSWARSTHFLSIKILCGRSVLPIVRSNGFQSLAVAVHHLQAAARDQVTTAIKSRYALRLLLSIEHTSMCSLTEPGQLLRETHAEGNGQCLDCSGYHDGLCHTATT